MNKEKCNKNLISAPCKLVLFSIALSLAMIADCRFILFLIEDSANYVAWLIFGFAIMFFSMIASIGIIMCYFSISIVKIYDNKIVIKRLFKKHEISFDNIKNIYITSEPRVGEEYFIDVDGYKKLAVSYPFKFERRRKSKKLIESFWDKPITRVKLESLVEIKK